MLIAIYNPITEDGTLERVGIINTETSAEYTANVRDMGSFSFSVHPSKADKLQKGKIISFDGFDGIITEIGLDRSSTQGYIKASGNCLKEMLSRRIIIPPLAEGESAVLGYDAVNGSSEYCIKHYWESNILNPTSEYRKIHGFYIGDNKDLGTVDDKYLARYNNVLEVSSEIASDAELGISAMLDIRQKKYIFDVFKGRDCTAGQSENPRLIFDVFLKNIISCTYTDSDKDLKNVFYTTMSGEEFADETLTMTYYRDDEIIPTGIERREQHLTLSADTPTAGEEYNELKRLAKIEMRDYVSVQSVTAQVTKYKYGVDYFLGDKVTVRIQELGVTADMEICGISKSFSSCNEETSVTFGEPALKPFDRVKRSIKNLKGVI